MIWKETPQGTAVCCKHELHYRSRISCKFSRPLRSLLLIPRRTRVKPCSPTWIRDCLPFFLALVSSKTEFRFIKHVISKTGHMPTDRIDFCTILNWGMEILKFGCDQLPTAIVRAKLLVSFHLQGCAKIDFHRTFCFKRLCRIRRFL